MVSYLSSVCFRCLMSNRKSMEFVLVPFEVYFLHVMLKWMTVLFHVVSRSVCSDYFFSVCDAFVERFICREESLLDIFASRVRHCFVREDLCRNECVCVCLQIFACNIKQEPQTCWRFLLELVTIVFQWISGMAKCLTSQMAIAATNIVMLEIWGEPTTYSEESMPPKHLPIHLCIPKQLIVDPSWFFLSLSFSFDLL